MSIDLIPTWVKVLVVGAALSALVGGIYYEGGRAPRAEVKVLEGRVQTLRKTLDDTIEEQKRYNLAMAAKAASEAAAWKEKVESNEKTNAANLRLIAWLRNRPDRPNGVQASPATAQGSDAGTPGAGLPGKDGELSSGQATGGTGFWATGAQLFRPDAEFLVSEATRANRIRSALKECYSVLDTAALSAAQQGATNEDGRP